MKEGVDHECFVQLAERLNAEGERRLLRSIISEELTGRGIHQRCDKYIECI